MVEAANFVEQWHKLWAWLLKDVACLCKSSKIWGPGELGVEGGLCCAADKNERGTETEGVIGQVCSGWLSQS